MSERGVVYLIHFDTPYKHAAHYLGWSADLEERLDAHAKGFGARLMEVITQAGITWRLARTWPGSRRTERKLKNQKHSPRLCPICAAQRLALPGEKSGSNPHTGGAQ